MKMQNNAERLTTNNPSSIVLDGGAIRGLISGGTYKRRDGNMAEAIEVTVPKDGRSYTVTYTPKNGNTEANYFRGAFQQGNLSVTSNGNVLTFTANANALPTDTFKFKEVTLKVV